MFRSSILWTAAAVAVAVVLGATSVWGATTEQEAKLMAADARPWHSFGRSVALDGDTAVVGAPTDNDNGVAAGAAYVFTRTAGVWTEQVKLMPADGTHHDWFGWSVSLAGDTAIVGAKQDDENGERSGSAYVFTRTGGVWTEQAKLLPADAAAYEYFGYSVAVHGDTALVGKYLDSETGLYAGAAYVFVRTGGVWSEQAKLLAPDGADHDYFGYAVALDGETALIGALLDDDVVVNEGSAYVFARTEGVWSEPVKLLASDATVDAHFGQAVALAGNSALIGSQGVRGKSGKAYVFVRTGDVWTEQTTLLASDAAGYDEFGDTVALDGGTAVIGAWADEDYGFRSGSAYVFVREDGIWSEQAKLLASDGAARDDFGIAVAVDDDTAVIGAKGDDDHGEGSGAAYVFTVPVGDGDEDEDEDSDEFRDDL